MDARQFNPLGTGTCGSWGLSLFPSMLVAVERNLVAKRLFEPKTVRRALIVLLSNFIALLCREQAFSDFGVSCWLAERKPIYYTVSC